MEKGFVDDVAGTDYSFVSDSKTYKNTPGFESKFSSNGNKKPHYPRPSGGSTTTTTTTKETISDSENAIPIGGYASDDNGNRDSEKSQKLLSSSASGSSSHGKNRRFDNMEEQNDDDSTRGAHNIDTTSVKRSKRFKPYVIMAVLMIVFIALAVTAGIRCSMKHECSIHEVPSVALLLNSTETNLVTSAGLYTLISIHLVLTGTTSYMVYDRSRLSVFSMFLAAGVMYVMVFVALNVPQWYISLVPLMCMTLWEFSAILGLWKFYRDYPTKRLVKISFVLALIVFVCNVLYIAFSAVPYEFVPGKNVAIFVMELCIVIFNLTFVAILIAHTSRVAFRMEVDKGYNTVDYH